MPKMHWYGGRFSLNREEPPRGTKSVLVSPDVFRQDISDDVRTHAMVMMGQRPGVRFLLPTRCWDSLAVWWMQEGWRWHEEWPLNVWLGAWVRNQSQVDQAVPLLLKTGARVWVYASPMRGRVDLTRWLAPECPVHHGRVCGCLEELRRIFGLVINAGSEKTKEMDLRMTVNLARLGGVSVVVESPENFEGCSSFMLPF